MEPIQPKVDTGSCRDTAAIGKELTFCNMNFWSHSEMLQSECSQKVILGNLILHCDGIKKWGLGDGDSD